MISNINLDEKHSRRIYWQDTVSAKTNEDMTIGKFRKKKPSIELEQNV